MVIVKGHEKISFKLSKWLKKYIILNTQKRNKAESDIEKDFYKLINNGAFGKFLKIIQKSIKNKIYYKKL